MKVDDEVTESAELKETKKRKVSSTKDSEDTQTGTAVSEDGNKGDKWLLCLFLLWFLTLVKTPVFILWRGSIESGQGR